MKEERPFGRDMGQMKRGFFAPREGFAGGGRPWMQRPLLRRLLMRKLMQRRNAFGETPSGMMEGESDVGRLEQIVDRIESRMDEILREIKDLKQLIGDASHLRSSPKVEEPNADDERVLKSGD